MWSWRETLNSWPWYNYFWSQTKNQNNLFYLVLILMCAKEERLVQYGMNATKPLNNSTIFQTLNRYQVLPRKEKMNSQCLSPLSNWANHIYLLELVLGVNFWWWVYFWIHSNAGVWEGSFHYSNRVRLYSVQFWDNVFKIIISNFLQRYCSTLFHTFRLVIVVDWSK